MPFKSKAQQGMIGHLEDIGEVPEGTTKHWGDVTPDIKNLPEHVSDKKKKHKKEASYSYIRGYMAGYMEKDR